MLLAVTAGCEEAVVAGYAIPAETGTAEVVVTDISLNGLRKALNQVDDGGTITFDGTGTIVINSALPLNKSITVNGGGTVTLQGGGENFLFLLQSGCTNLVFNGLILTNGYATQSGTGGIASVGEGKTVTLNHCNIYGNQAIDANGEMGGAFCVSGTLNMTSHI